MERGRMEREEGMRDELAREALVDAMNLGSWEHRSCRKRPHTKLCSMAKRVAALREETPSLL